MYGENPDAPFYQLIPVQIGWSYFGTKIKCVEVPYEIVGNFDTEYAHIVRATFIKCDRDLRDDCRSESEIN